MSLAISRAIVRNKELKKESLPFKTGFSWTTWTAFLPCFSAADRSFSASFALLLGFLACFSC